MNVLVRLRFFEGVCIDRCTLYCIRRSTRCFAVSVSWQRRNNAVPVADAIDTPHVEISGQCLFRVTFLI
jgi:hypothetical protein